jgi:hypothetical protein
MGRRGHPCRCCGCDDCEQAPSLLVAHIEYDTTGGEIIKAQKDGQWDAVTTTCSIEPARVGIARLRITDQGEGYTLPPSITLAGGGGTQTSYSVTIESPIVSIDVTNPGSGYTTAPTVKISSPGGGLTVTKATAKAFVEDGSVSKIDLEVPGLYRNVGTNFAPTGTWPTITLSGNATAVPVFAGKVVAASAVGTGYTSVPTVKFDGGGGKNAAAVAELTWEQEHDRTDEFDNCRAAVGLTLTDVSIGGPELVCLDADSTKFPPRSFGPCGFTHAEQAGWGVVGSSSSAAATIDEDDVIAGEPPINRTSFVFDGEAVWARVSRSWAVHGDDLTVPDFFGVTVQQTWNTYYLQRFYSRVPPQVVYRISLPQQEGGTNVTLTPTWRQYVDRKNDSFWYLEALAITNAGQNLRIPVGLSGGTSFILAAEGNSRHVCSFPRMTFTRSAPAAAALSLSGFSTQPQLSVAFAESATPGLFEVTGVTLTSGGQTDLEDGPVQILLELEAGYYDEGGQAVLTGTVSGGVLASVVVSSVGSIVPPATLSAVELPEDPFFTNTSRVATGESPFVVTREHAEPTVAASTSDGINTYPLAVTLAQDTDSNGDDYWRVTSVSGGVPEGFDRQNAVLFEVQNDGIESVAAVASPLFDGPDFVGYLIVNPGRYFQRTITPTSDPLPPIQCLGELTEERGWELNEQELITAQRSYEVGEAFRVEQQNFGALPTFTELDRVRRCPLPDITLEFQ